MEQIRDIDPDELRGGAEFSPGPDAGGGTLSVAPGVVAPPGADTASARRRRRKLEELTVDDHVDGVLAGDRVILGRTITLVESSLPAHTDKALAVIERVLPHTGGALRIGITGAPGAGKSTFIEAFGGLLTGDGHRLAVLAIDPSSTISGGSIMGDKTRMEKLSADPRAFIRPSPSAGSLGGVARKTREAMLLCEAAGYDVVLIETVGVGQSETLVGSMVDFFLLLLLAGAGDQLQGIKRGIMELADAIAITKADGENVDRARHAASEYRNALHFLTPRTPRWTPPVHPCSALTGDGLRELWRDMQAHRTHTEQEGLRARVRAEQSRAWMDDAIRQTLEQRFRAHPAVAPLLHEMEVAVTDGREAALVAARRLLEAFFNDSVHTL